MKDMSTYKNDVLFCTRAFIGPPRACVEKTGLVHETSIAVSARNCVRIRKGGFEVIWEKAV